jgi:hypothetical protein
MDFLVKGLAKPGSENPLGEWLPPKAWDLV